MEDTQKVSPETEALTQFHGDAVTLLRSVRESLADILRRLIDGDATALKEIAAKHNDLESALRRVFEAEQKFNERHGRKSGTAGDEIDFDAIRADIGCRLHRLRTCCDADRVS